MLKCQLAKIYNKDKTPKSEKGYYITEKLDGNRCIAEYNGKNWIFYSRNGKLLNVEFNLETFDKTKIYDGEIITVEAYKDRKKTDFNALNGIIQKDYTNKPLVYCVFDIQDRTKDYTERRKELDGITNTENAFILPILKHCKDENELNEIIPELLQEITENGGEGLIINNGDAVYKTIRTNDLLKVKNNYTIDLKVIGIEYGKHNDRIGALKCKTIADDKTIITDIGAGFTDAQRKQWHENPTAILGKIIEVKYFELTQNAETQGTNTYSLRFPRFKAIRHDKTESSEIIESYKNEPTKAEYKPKTTPKPQTPKENKFFKGLKFIGSIFLLVIECIFTLIGTIFGVNLFLDLFDKK